MTIYHQTERLLLRRFTLSDVDLLVELDSDPEVMRFLTGGAATPRATIESEVLPAILRMYEQFPGYGQWAAMERERGEFVGWFELEMHPETPPGEPGLGYRLRRSAWGKGYATEGSRALIEKAFTELGATRIVADTMTVNTGSRRVMEKLGMTHRRTFFAEWPEYIDGAEHGDVEYALTRAEWERRIGQ